jgi:hypothetical protein
MMWKELALNKPASLTFPDGTEAVVSYYSQIERSVWRGHAGTVFPGSSELDLLDAVDDGQTVDEPRIHAIYGVSHNHVFLFGGPTAYRIDSAAIVRERIELYREREFEEYWHSAIASTGAGILVIYESGCLLLDNALQVRWHVKKYFNDFFYKVSGDELHFLRDHDHGKRWSLALADGHVIEPSDGK